MSGGLVLFFDLKRGPEMVGLCPRRLRQEIADGMPCLRTPGKILLDPVKVRAWLEGRYTPKSVDIEAAFGMAESLTSRRQRKERTR